METPPPHPPRTHKCPLLKCFPAPRFAETQSFTTGTHAVFTGVLTHNVTAAAAALFGGEVCGTSCYGLCMALWSHSDGIYMDSFAAFAYGCTVAARPGGGQTLGFQQLSRPLRIANQEAKYLGGSKAFVYTPSPLSNKHTNT